MEQLEADPSKQIATLNMARLNLRRLSQGLPTHLRRGRFRREMKKAKSQPQASPGMFLSRAAHQYPQKVCV